MLGVPVELTLCGRRDFVYGQEKLVIGKYCAIVTGTTFVMSGANHLTTGVSTFPFTIFGGDWAEGTLDLMLDIPSRGNTAVGNDVWFGYRTLIMPGVPPYAIVGGNPAKVVKQRYPEDDVARLLRAAWWDWPTGLVTGHVRTIMSGTPADIEEIARHNGLMTG